MTDEKRDPMAFRETAKANLAIWSHALNEEFKCMPVYCPLCQRLVSGDPKLALLFTARPQGKCECDPAAREAEQARIHAEYQAEVEQRRKDWERRHGILQALADSNLPYDAGSMPYGWGEVVAELAQEALRDDGRDD